MSTTRIQIGPDDHGRTMSLEEFREADEEAGYRYELARGGVLEVIEFPQPPHHRVVSQLFQLAVIYCREHPRVIDYFGGGTEVRAWQSGIDLARHPDFGVVFHGTTRDEVGDLKAGLVAEVVSPSSKTRDYQDKRQDYLVYGIQEYWIVDPIQRQVTVLARQGDGADASWLETVCRDADVIESPALPGLRATVDGLWAGL